MNDKINRIESIFGHNSLTKANQFESLRALDTYIVLT